LTRLSTSFEVGVVPKAEGVQPERDHFEISAETAPSRGERYSPAWPQLRPSECRFHEPAARFG
jgi:hypothetical protein